MSSSDIIKTFLLTVKAESGTGKTRKRKHSGESSNSGDSNQADTSGSEAGRRTEKRAKIMEEGEKIFSRHFFWLS